MKKVLLLLTACSSCYSSVLHQVAPIPAPLAPAPIAAPIIAPAGVILPPPVVAATSSQYFERIFNRLIVAPPVEATVVPFAPTPTVLTIPTVNPAKTETDSQNNNGITKEDPQQNFAFAVATAQAAPVATILLPPYPFASNIRLIPVNAIPTEENRKETEPTTANPDIQETTDVSNNFAQGFPSGQQPDFSKPQKIENLNQNGFNQYEVPKTPLPVTSANNNAYNKDVNGYNNNINGYNSNVNGYNNHNGYNNNDNAITNNGYDNGHANNGYQNNGYNHNVNGNANNGYQNNGHNHNVNGNANNGYQNNGYANNNIGFNQYAPPKPQKLESFHQKEQKVKHHKLKTAVEVVPVPLTYIAPPPLKQAIKHKHVYVPKSKIIIRPISSPIIARPVRIIVRKKYSKIFAS